MNASVIGMCRFVCSHNFDTLLITSFMQVILFKLDSPEKCVSLSSFQYMKDLLEKGSMFI